MGLSLTDVTPSPDQHQPGARRFTERIKVKLKTAHLLYVGRLHWQSDGDLQVMTGFTLVRPDAA